MQNLPKGGYFVWGNRDITYPKRLAHDLGRDDIIVVSVGFLDNRGLTAITTVLSGMFTGIVVDHAAELSVEQNSVYKNIRSNIPIVPRNGV